MLSSALYNGSREMYRSPFYMKEFDFFQSRIFWGLICTPVRRGMHIKSQFVRCEVTSFNLPHILEVRVNKSYILCWFKKYFIYAKLHKSGLGVTK